MAMITKKEKGLYSLSIGTTNLRKNSQVPGFYHVPLSALITGIGNFSIQMNYQSISTALMVMSVVVCTSSLEDCKGGIQAPWVDSSNAATVFAGSILGQLCMGYAGDVLGINSALTMTMSVSFVAILCSSLLTLLFPSESATDVYVTIMVSRFFLGIGLGGVYPLAATKAAEAGTRSCTGTGTGTDMVEQASPDVSPLNSACSFFWQTPGAMAPWLLLLGMTHSRLSTAARWRLLLGMGAIPNVMVLICLLLENKQNKELNTTEDGKNMKISKAPSRLGCSDGKKSVLKLIFEDEYFIRKVMGTGGSWFVFDICYYGVVLFGGDILSAIRSAHDTTGDDDLAEDITTDTNLQYIAMHQVLALSMGVPGVLLSILLMNHMCVKNIQILGFFAMSVLFAIMALLFDHLIEKSPDVLYALYCVLLFALQFGPNVTTFVMPAIAYPHEVRSTMTGISAAFGKVGAVCGAYIFGWMARIVGYPVIMFVCAALSLLGVYLTQVCITTTHTTTTTTNTGGGGGGMIEEDEGSIDIDSSSSPLALSSTLSSS